MIFRIVDGLLVISQFMLSEFASLPIFLFLFQHDNLHRLCYAARARLDGMP